MGKGWRNCLLYIDLYLPLLWGNFLIDRRLKQKRKQETKSSPLDGIPLPIPYMGGNVVKPDFA